MALVVVAVGIGAWVFGAGAGDDPSTPEVAVPATTADPTAAPAAATSAPTVTLPAANTAPRPTPAAAAAATTPTPVATRTLEQSTPAPGPTADSTTTPEPTAAPASGERDPEAAPPAEAAEDKVAEEPAASADSGDTVAAGDAMDEPSEAPESSSERSDATERRRAALSAGEVDDNERWDEYVHYRNQYSGPPVHDVDVTERYIITVIHADGRAVHNASVRVSAGDTVLFEGRTYANGQTLFFPRAFAGSEGAESFTLLVETDATGEQREFTRGEGLDWDVTLDVTRAATEGGVRLDILFLLDATGSMEDEIEQIKDTLLSISSRISDLPSQPDLRLGMVAYRDRGDDFVTRVFDFERNAARFLETIRGVDAHGGGDDPEALNQALHAAVHEPGWRLEEDAVRLIFLIADAPPHLDYVEDYSYAVEMIEAHRRGIKIFSIASSGLDEQGEYVFRQIAQHTMGRFIFIVYGAGGTTPHSVGEYSVERLDDLVVSLVQEELAFLGR